MTEPQYFKGLERELSDVVIDVRPFRKDPAALAAAAKDLKNRESNVRNSAAGRDTDGFQRVYVVTDVDEFTVKQFQEARRICKSGDMELIINNPRFEVWLIDHIISCPDVFSDTKDVERKAAGLGIVGGSRDKHIFYQSIEGKRTPACSNAATHNTPSRKRGRDQLNNMGFGP